MRNTNHPHARGKGRERMTAMGEMKGGGGFFVHYSEQFDPTGTVHAWRNVEIKFPGVP